MAGDNSSRAFVNFWWILALTLCAVAGAFSADIVGLSGAVWGIVGLGVPIAAAAGLLGWFSARRLRGTNSSQNRKRRPLRRDFKPPPLKGQKSKAPVRHGQLYAIRGNKTADPPSSGGS